ncbi:MAG: hypothetical protein H6955_18865 [Chromatiaceae bacterium]|nr:hypothetical protein [Chromatiaceae bacterium]
MFAQLDDIDARIRAALAALENPQPDMALAGETVHGALTTTYRDGVNDPDARLTWILDEDAVDKLETQRAAPAAASQ